MKRRQCLDALGWGVASVGLTGLVWSGRALADGGSGPVLPPVPAPNLPLLDHLGRPQRLQQWMQGRVTLLQTIFTGCSSVCPIQGAVFSQLQRLIAKQPPRRPVQLLSVSIDALGDTPQALRQWLEHMQALPTGWAAALPKPEGVDVLRRSLYPETVVSAADRDAHSERVYFFNPQAQLCWRSSPLPSVDELFRVMNHLSAAT